MGSSTKMAVMIALVGLSFTFLVNAYFAHFEAKESRALLAQNHRATLKILSRDVDDLRHQLVGIYGKRYAPYLGSLTFQKNGRGHVGVRGRGPVEAWIPIENSNASAFRGSLPQKQRVFAEVYDGDDRVLDHSSSPRPKKAIGQMTSAIPGSNLVLRSHLAPAEGRLSLALLVALAAAFWINAAGLFWILIDDEVHLAAARPRAEVYTPHDQLSFRQKKLIGPLRARMLRDFHEVGALNVVRISLPQSGVIEDQRFGLSNLIHNYGFGGHHVARANQLLVHVEKDQAGSLQRLLHAMNERLQTALPGAPALHATESMLLSNVEINAMIDRLEKPDPPLKPQRRTPRPYLNARKEELKAAREFLSPRPRDLDFQG